MAENKGSDVIQCTSTAEFSGSIEGMVVNAPSLRDAQ